uniref:Uncharacterized protein n=1 Tax=viral metagenome TaxID=1070528 RepID=A0A6C0HYT0_9ZZZZ
MYNFKNCILIVVFNYSNCVCNKEFIKNIYRKHFKQIVFYSDIPEIQKYNDVHYMDIHQGYYTQKVFKHFYDNYTSLIEESDGLFYTMDDNIININILNLFDNQKIIYYYNEVKTLDNYSGWQWDRENGKYGKNAIINMMNDNENKLDRFSGDFSDWFYLPKKYLTKELFQLFDLFAKYCVFLEIAIPSIINNIEKDKTQYQSFTHEMLWNDRSNFCNKDYLYNSLNHQHNLILHPIKFNQNPETKQWLEELFCKQKCVIITTINGPTETILKHIRDSKDYDIIIVGDNKTPDHYKSLECVYLDIESQKKLFPELSDLLPYNHYCRKNLGYMYAIKKGYEIIYETDDDNIPYDNFDNILLQSNNTMISEENRWINIFKYFTNNTNIWPRGYPLSLVKSEPIFSIEPTDKMPSIVNGLVENDPDVDAIFRLVCRENIEWIKDKHVLIDNKNICVFNTQNTFWLNSELFMCLLIPCTVSFRYCDILRGIINNIVLKKTDNYMMYCSPNVIQIRNEHNLMQDFKSETEMYIHNENILEYIENNTDNVANSSDLMHIIYTNLLNNGVIKPQDIDVLNKWLSYF